MLRGVSLFVLRVALLVARRRPLSLYYVLHYMLRGVSLFVLHAALYVARRLFVLGAALYFAWRLSLCTTCCTTSLDLCHCLCLCLCLCRTRSQHSMSCNASLIQALPEDKMITPLGTDASAKWSS